VSDGETGQILEIQHLCRQRYSIAAVP